MLIGVPSTRRSPSICSAVHVLPMPDTHHRDEQLLAVKPVQHSVLSHAQASQPFPLSGEWLTCERIFEKTLDRLDNFSLVLPGEDGELLDRAPLPSDPHR